MDEGYHKIGQILKSFGVDGRLRFYIALHAQKDFLNVKYIFIYIRGQYLPYFIEEIEEMSDFIVKLEEVNNKEDANQLCNKEIFLHESQFRYVDPVAKVDEAYLIGAKVFDKDSLRGEVEGWIENRGLITLVVKTLAGKEAYIPFNDHLLLDFKTGSKELYFNLPDGLWELYI